MKKFSKIGKRVMALFIVALLNINTYATTSSNDGSSFITKAEFDTLINDFNNEMDKYQSGLNAKIDTAISSYLGGLSGTTNINETVAYFKIVPSSITSITMQPSDAFPYVKHKPYVNAGLVFGSQFYQGNTGVNYQFVGDANATYTGDTSGARRFVVVDSGVYRWAGYVTNYNEKFDISWNCVLHQTDTGFSNNVPAYLHVLGTTMFNDSSTVKNPSWNNIKWNFGDGGGHGVFNATNCTVSCTWPTEFVYKNQYDLIYDDAEITNQTADKMRFFISSNPNNYYFAGCSVSYLTVMNGASKSGYARMKEIKSNLDGGVYNLTFSNTIDTDGSSSYSGTAFMSCGYEGIQNWASVMSPDNTTYTYKEGSSTVSKNFQNYSMIGGAALIIAEQGAKYDWDVEFTDLSEDVTVWIKHDPFSGEPDSNECIKVSVDGGPKYNSATVKEGKGTISFTAEKNGLLFFKWSEGKAIDINKSKKITGKK